MKNRLLSILLCLVICALLLPTSVMAADSPVEITKVDVIGVPTLIIAGESTGISKSDITVTTQPENAVNIDAVYWYNIDTNKTDDAMFTPGNRYGLSVILSPKDGYTFSWDTSTSLRNYAGTATFNNAELAEVAWSYRNQDVALYIRSQGILAAPLKNIDTVNVSGVPTEIMAGASTEINVSDLTVTTEPENAVKIEAAYWYNLDTQTDQDTTFKPGNSYGLVAILSPEYGYTFDWDSTSLHNYTGTATFNNEKADVAWSHQNKDVKLYMRSQGIKVSSVIYVNGEQFTENKHEITCGSGKASYDPETNTLILDNARIGQTHLGYGIYAEDALNIVLKGSNSTTDLYAICVKGDLTVTGEGSLNVTGTGQSGEPTIYADGGKAVFDCAGDITIDSKTTCVSATNDVTLAGSGKITMESSRSGSMAVESANGDVIISGSGEVSLKGDAHAVGADLKLNGEATPITLSAFYSGTAVSGTVAGTTVDNYDVTGDPATASVTYELKTSCSHDNTEVKNAKDATCTEAGYTGDTYCKICGEKIADGTVINVKAHTYGRWRTITEPTLTQKGLKVRTCSVCGAKETQEIPVLTPAATEPTAPQTGDNSHIFLWIAVWLIGGALVGTTVYGRKKKTYCDK